MTFTFRYDVRWGRGGKLQPHENGEIAADGADEAAARIAAAEMLRQQFKDHTHHPMLVTVQACLTRRFGLRMDLRGMNAEGEVYVTFVQHDPLRGDTESVAAFVASLESIGFAVTR